VPYITREEIPAADLSAHFREGVRRAQEEINEVKLELKDRDCRLRKEFGDEIPDHLCELLKGMETYWYIHEDLVVFVEACETALAEKRVQDARKEASLIVPPSPAVEKFSLRLSQYKPGIDYEKKRQDRIDSQAAIGKSKRAAKVAKNRAAMPVAAVGTMHVPGVFDRRITLFKAQVDPSKNRKDRIDSNSQCQRRDRSELVRSKSRSESIPEEKPVAIEHEQTGMTEHEDVVTNCAAAAVMNGEQHGNKNSPAVVVVDESDIALDESEDAPAQASPIVVEAVSAPQDATKDRPDVYHLFLASCVQRGRTNTNTSPIASAPAAATTTVAASASTASVETSANIQASKRESLLCAFDVLPCPFIYHRQIS